MRKVTEHDLNQKIKSLHELMNTFEAYAPGTNPVPTQAKATTPVAPTQSLAQRIGNAGGTLAGDMASGASAFGDYVSGAANDLVSGAKQGWQGASPANYAAPTTAAKPAAAPVAPAQTAAKPRAAQQKDPKVMAIQNELIKRGAKITADGIMGPATQAAQQQFATGGPGAAPAGAAAQQQFATGGAHDRATEMDAYLKMSPEQQHAYNLAASKPTATTAATASNPPATSATATTPAASGFPGAQTSAQAEKAAITPAFASPVRESVTFGYDQELARIISLTRR